jgi:hypothetical protein
LYEAVRIREDVVGCNYHWFREILPPLCMKRKAGVLPKSSRARIACILRVDVILYLRVGVGNVVSLFFANTKGTFHGKGYHEHHFVLVHVNMQGRGT